MSRVGGLRFFSNCNSEGFAGGSLVHKEDEDGNDGYEDKPVFGLSINGNDDKISFLIHVHGRIDPFFCLVFFF